MYSGILGGTFDPPHKGHLALADAAIEKLGLSRVIFVPAGVPPHKSAKIISTQKHRLKMMELAIAGRTEFELSRIELERPGKSYTIETILDLKKIYPDDQFFFLLGADNVREMNDWFQPERIFENATVAAVNRPGFRPAGRFASGVRYFDMEPVPISSTLIREKIKGGESIAGLVEPEVERYIMDNSLYK